MKYRRRKRERRWSENTHVTIATALTLMVVAMVFGGFYRWGPRTSEPVVAAHVKGPR
jgi:hypothetical protein